MGIIFIAFGLAALFVSVKVKALYKMGLRKAKAHYGQIATYVKKYKGSRALNPLIKVELDGHDRYFVSPTGSFPPSGNIGDRVEVLLDPRDANRATVPMKFVPKVCTFVAVMGVAFIGVGASLLLSQRLGSFLYIDLIFGAVFVGMGLYKYKNLSPKRKPFNRKIKELLRTGSFYEEFETEEAVQKMLAGEHTPENKFGRTSEQLSGIQRYKQRTKPTGSGGYVTALVMGLVGIGLITAGIWKAQETYEFKQTASRAPGKIVDRQVNRGSGTTYTPIFSFRPLNQDKDYKFKGGFSSSHPTWRVGDEIYVLYDPSNPNEAIQDDGLWNYMLAIFFCVLGGFFSLFGVAALQSMNDKGLKRPPNLKPEQDRQDYSTRRRSGW